MATDVVLDVVVLKAGEEVVLHGDIRVGVPHKQSVLVIFANQVLTAKSWYKGMNAPAAEDAIREMIDAVVNNTGGDMQTIIDTAASKVQQTVN